MLCHKEFSELFWTRMNEDYWQLKVICSSEDEPVDWHRLMGSMCKGSVWAADHIK